MQILTKLINLKILQLQISSLTKIKGVRLKTAHLLFFIQKVLNKNILLPIPMFHIRLLSAYSADINKKNSFPKKNTCFMKQCGLKSLYLIMLEVLLLVNLVTNHLS